MIDKRTEQPAKPKHAGGRPSKYRPEFVHWAQKFARLGSTIEEMAQAFEVAPVQVTRWMEMHPEFRTAIAQGRAFSDANMAHSLYRRGMGARVKTSKPVVLKTDAGQVIQIVEYEEGYPPDTMAASLWLRNRRPDLWRDKVEHDVTLTGRIGRLPDDARLDSAMAGLMRLAGKLPVEIEGTVADAAPQRDDASQQSGNKADR